MVLSRLARCLLVRRSFSISQIPSLREPMHTAPDWLDDCGPPTTTPVYVVRISNAGIRHAPLLWSNLILVVRLIEENVTIEYQSIKVASRSGRLITNPVLKLLSPYT